MRSMFQVLRGAVKNFSDDSYAARVHGTPTHRSRPMDPSPRRPRRTRLGLSVLVLVVGTAAFGSLSAASGATQQATAKLPKALWAVEIDARAARSLSVARLTAVRRAGINALVADPRRVNGRSLRTLRSRAARAGLTVVVPKRGRTGAVVLARSTRDASSLMRARGVGLVVVRVASPSAAAALARGPDRVLALSRLTPSPAQTPNPWRGAIRIARSSAMLDLGVTAPSPHGGALNAFLSLLTESAG